MRKLLPLLALLFLLPVPSQGYIAVNASRLTLCEVMLEFPNVLVLTVEKCDAEKGAFIFKVSEVLQGKAPEGTIKHALLQDGKTPERLKKLAVGDVVISFMGSPDNRSINFCKGGWYLTNPNQGWERYAQFRDDFNALYIGEPKELGVAVKSLNEGKPVVVQVRSEGIPETPAIFVKFDPDYPHRRTPAFDPKLGKTRSVEVLKKLVEDKNPAERTRVSLELGMFAGGLFDHRAELLKMLKDSHPEVRLAALQGLAKNTGDKKEIVEALIKALNDEDRFVCATAAYVLGQYGEAAKPALKPLVDSLKDRNYDFDFRPHRAAEAAETILKISDDKNACQSAVQLLTSDKMLNDERVDSEGTRTAAARALGRCGPSAKGALPQLVKRLKDPLPETRIACAEAVLLIGGSEKEVESSRKVLEAELQKGTVSSRIKALRAVQTTNQTSLMGELEKLTKDPSQIIQTEAKKVIEKLKAPKG